MQQRAASCGEKNVVRICTICVYCLQDVLPILQFSDSLCDASTQCHQNSQEHKFISLISSSYFSMFAVPWRHHLMLIPPCRWMHLQSRGRLRRACAPCVHGVQPCLVVCSKRVSLLVTPSSPSMKPAPSIDNMVESDHFKSLLVLCADAFTLWPSFAAQMSVVSAQQSDLASCNDHIGHWRGLRSLLLLSLSSSVVSSLHHLWYGILSSVLAAIRADGSDSSFVHWRDAYQLHPVLFHSLDAVAQSVWGRKF